MDPNDYSQTDLRRHRVVGRGLRADRPLPLRALRQSLQVTQVELAEKAGMSQGDVSRLEQRADVKLSTLHRYVAALGGTVEVRAVLPSGHRILLDLSGTDPA